MINALIRAVYRLAHWGLRLLWFIRRPETAGALVAVWYEGRVLLVKNSYTEPLIFAVVLTFLLLTRVKPIKKAILRGRRNVENWRVRRSLATK